MQATMSKSSTEAEYQAMSSTCAEIVWICRLLFDFDVNFASPTPLFCDNQSVTKIACNQVFHERIKHIEVACHFVHEKFEQGLINLPHVSSKKQLADFLTKSQSHSCHNIFLSKLLMSLHQFEGGCKQ